MVILVIIFLALSIAAFFIYRRRRPSANKYIRQIYEAKEGRFVVGGKKNKFKICKNNNIEFLVENGQIIACKDKRVSNEFKFYGGK